MIQCPGCAAVHPNNTLYCPACGQFLLTASVTGNLGTVPEDIQHGDLAPRRQMVASPAHGTLEIVRFTIGRNGRQVDLPLKQELLLGRQDPLGDVHPDLDLTPDAGLALGVSRRHARLAHTSLSVIIEDLGSANGTFYNGRRLPPHQAQELQDGDELVLGKLAVRVHFATVDASDSRIKPGLPANSLDREE
jgi:hypothetical protein